MGALHRGVFRTTFLYDYNQPIVHFIVTYKNMNEVFLGIL